MEYEAKVTKKRPVFWGTMSHCIDGFGRVLHFPEGDYRKQVSTKAGQAELEFMTMIAKCRHYVNHRPSAKEKFHNPQYDNFEQWVEDSDWRIPIVERVANGR